MGAPLRPSGASRFPVVQGGYAFWVEAAVTGNDQMHWTSIIGSGPDGSQIFSKVQSVAANTHAVYLADDTYGLVQITAGVGTWHTLGGIAMSGPTAVAADEACVYVYGTVAGKTAIYAIAPD